MRFSRIVATSCLGLLLTACPKENATELTRAEAVDALEESTIGSQAAALTASSVEIATNFTLGEGVRDAAAELKTFVETQLPCAEIIQEDATLSITYGAKPGMCLYRGHAFHGKQSITVTKNDDVVEVDHTWTGLSNGILEVTGTAHVTWDFGGQSRHVEHDLVWTRLRDGRTGHGTGDYIQTPLEGGVAEGIQVDGSRSWEGKGGQWDLAIEAVQARWADPIPQAGTYRLATPKNRSLAISFKRVSKDTIEVTLTSDDKSYAFRVRGTAGIVEDAS
jgi:hypothetical protein